MRFRYGNILAIAALLAFFLAAPSRAQQQPDVSRGWTQRMERLSDKYERFKEQSRARVLAMADSLQQVARAEWAQTKRLARRDNVPLTYETEKGYTAILYDTTAAVRRSISWPTAKPTRQPRLRFPT
jgi:hypothetical protein